MGRRQDAAAGHDPAARPLNKFFLSSLAWPDLGSDEASRLAAAGRRLAAASPRPSGVAANKPPASKDGLQADVEALVARDYGLDGGDLETMLADDPCDRGASGASTHASPARAASRGAVAAIADVVAAGSRKARTASTAVGRPG